MKKGETRPSLPRCLLSYSVLPFHGLLQELSVGRILSCECLSFVLYANHNQRFRTIVAHRTFAFWSHAHYASFPYRENLSVHLKFTLSTHENI